MLNLGITKLFRENTFFPRNKLSEVLKNLFYEKNFSYVLVLINDKDFAGFVFSHHFVVGPHGCTDNDVIESVAVEIAGSDRVAEVGPDLVARHVVQVRQVGVVENNLSGLENSLLLNDMILYKWANTRYFGLKFKD